jgi:hypothetical protein
LLTGGSGGPDPIRGHFSLRLPLPEVFLTTFPLKTTPCFPETTISVPDCWSGIPGVPGIIHKLQRYNTDRTKSPAMARSMKETPFSGSRSRRRVGWLRRRVFFSGVKNQRGNWDPPGIPDPIRGHFSLRSPHPGAFLTMFLTKTAPRFPGVAIFSPDYWSDMVSAPGIFSIQQRYSGRCKKRCAGGGRGERNPCFPDGRVTGRWVFADEKLNFTSQPFIRTPCPAGSSRSFRSNRGSEDQNPGPN